MAFIYYLANIRQLSPHTLSNYQRDLNKLAAYCKQQNIHHSKDICAADIRRWIANLHRTGLAGTSIQRTLSAARSFFKHLITHQQLKNNPTSGIQAPKSNRKLPSTLNADQMNQFLSSKSETGEANDWLSLRDQAMMELFYSSGLRLSELVNLDLAQIDRQDQLVTVTGKSNKTRTLPVGRLALKSLNAWLAVRLDVPAAAQTSALFISRRGQRISTRNVQKRIQLHGVKQEVAQQVHPHMLRHSFASHMLESSGDLRAVQELLGHANISTTQIYTHLDFQHLAKIYDQAHPRANRKK